MTAKEIYELVQQELLFYGYDCTYMSGNQITKSSGTESYLLKEQMLNIVEQSGGLKDNEINFMNQCFNTKSMNTCNGTEQIVVPIELINISDINVIFCMKYGQDYVNEMTKNYKGN